jgi:Rrf2 family protein
MLSLTKKTGYGLIAMTYLARLAVGRLASAREIADHFGLPLSLLMNVLKDLSAAGYVESVRGSHGGYRLARSADQINLAGMIEAVEGPIRLARCVTDATGTNEQCQTMAQCPVADPVHRVQRRINDFLKQLTLAEVLEPLPSFSRDPKGSASAEHNLDRDSATPDPVGADIARSDG